MEQKNSGLQPNNGIYMELLRRVHRNNKQSNNRHNFTNPGNFTVSLTVTDSVGRTATASAVIQVLNITTKTYDINGDGKIDMKDVIRVALAFGSKPGDPRWDPVCDFNKDGIADMRDIIPVALNFGKDP